MSERVKIQSQVGSEDNFLIPPSSDTGSLRLTFITHRIGNLPSHLNTGRDWILRKAVGLFVYKPSCQQKVKLLYISTFLVGRS